MKNTLLLSFAICLLLGFSPPVHARSMTKSGPGLAYTNSGACQATTGYDFGDKKKKKKKKKKKGNDGGVDFQHGIGATLFIAPSTAGDEDNSAIAYGISYFPSIRLAGISDALSLRLAASPTFGISGSVNSREGGSLSIAFELPLDAELHFGDQDMEGFGGHVGAGFAYNRIASSDFGDNTALGPHFTAGIKGLFKGNMFTIRGSFLLNISSKKDDYGFDGKNVIGVSIAKYF